MANSIEFAKNYTGTLDEVYQGAAVSRCLNSGGRMVRAGRNAKEILIPKISVTGLGDYTRNVGYKTGSITYEYETHSFGYDRAIRLFADVTDVEESGVLDCFVEAGAELQRTQVAPEGDAYTFSQIASTDGVTVKGEDLSEASAVDVLDALRTVTNDMDERRVSTGSRYLFITPTLRGVLDDFSLANPTRSNRVLERFSRIVEVPQVRFYTAIACSPATTTSSATREGRRFLCRHHGHRGGQLEDLLHQERRRVHGRGVANQERARELLALGLAHVQQLQPPGGRDGRLRALYDERSERVQAGRGRRADRSQRRPAHVVLGVLLRRLRGRAHGELNAGLDARACDIEQDLRHRQVRGAGLHALGRRYRADAPPAPHQRDFRCGHGHILVPEPELPVLLVHESGQRERAGQPLRRALDALHVQLLRVHDHRLPGLRPIDVHGPVLHVLGVQQAHHDLRELDLGASLERHHGLAMLLLVLHVAGGWQRYRVGQQQDGVHVFQNRCCSHAGVCHRSLMVQRVREFLMHH